MAPLYDGRFHDGRPREGRRTRVLVLFSDTGGGHRSAAEALIEAWEAAPEAGVQADMVDVFRHFSRWPFSRFGPLYPWLVRHAGAAWAGLYHASDSPRRARALARTSYGYLRRPLHRLLDRFPADVLVSVHPLFNHALSWALRERGQTVPFATVVTDLGTTHAFWFHPGVDRVIVPTEAARQCALACGVPDGRVRVRGLPVSRRFTLALEGLPDRERLRRSLGLDPRGPVVLLTGGGDGLGPLYATARAVEDALAAREPATQLVVITGRNAALAERLRADRWRIGLRVEGFVRDMPRWMAAADVLLTKAGPGTITEGLLSGLPLILIGRIPGQEDGNVDYVVQSGAGVWEPQPARAAACLRRWLAPGNSELAGMAARARTLADPQAAALIAGDVLELARSRRPEPAAV